MRAVVVAFVLAACQRSPAQPLYPAGSERDEGHGLLARASSRMMTSEEPDAPAAAKRTPRARFDEDEYAYGGMEYGGAEYGGAFAFGGAAYGAYQVPPWPYPHVNRTPSWSQREHLRAAIEGTIRWRGATPTLTTSCGAITPVRANANRTLPGVVVYLERVQAGRMTMHAAGEMRPAIVGGVVVKRGCELRPSAQVVTPVPAQVAIHGDRTSARLVVTLPQGAPRKAELQEAGRIAIPMKKGTLEVHAEDASLGAAFVLGIDTPAYAITDDTGRFRLDELAPGTYDLVAWHPPIPTLSSGKLVYGEPIIVRREIRVVGTGTQRVDLTLAPRK